MRRRVLLITALLAFCLASCQSPEKAQSQESTVLVNGDKLAQTQKNTDSWGETFPLPEGGFFVAEGESRRPETEEIAALKEKYPEYFGLSTFKGLEVYVWQMTPGLYSFGLMEGTNREKSMEELWNMKPATPVEMGAILSTYEIDQDEIIIIFWQNPLSSYMPPYWIVEPGESEASVALRRQEYINEIRRLLFGSEV